MKINMNFGINTLLAAMLLVSMAFVPAVSAAENNMEANNSEIPHFDSWTKPQDLSRFDGYKPQIKKVPL